MFEKTKKIYNKSADIFKAKRKKIKDVSLPGADDADGVGDLVGRHDAADLSLCLYRRTSMPERYMPLKGVR
jgi:hypothetical protein